MWRIWTMIHPRTSELNQKILCSLVCSRATMLQKWLGLNNSSYSLRRKTCISFFFHHYLELTVCLKLFVSTQTAQIHALVHMAFAGSLSWWVTLRGFSRAVSMLSVMCLQGVWREQQCFSFKLAATSGCKGKGWGQPSPSPIDRIPSAHAAWVLLHGIAAVAFIKLYLEGLSWA